MRKNYVIGYVNVYVACSSNDGVLVGSTDMERAKFALEGQYLVDVADQVVADYWIEVYDGKNIIGIIDFNKETMEFKYNDNLSKGEIECILASEMNTIKISVNPNDCYHDYSISNGKDMYCFHCGKKLNNNSYSNFFEKGE